jgi:hypothetical protein
MWRKKKGKPSLKFAAITQLCDFEMMFSVSVFMSVACSVSGVMCCSSASQSGSLNTCGHSRHGTSKAALKTCFDFVFEEEVI